jgi:hypothetical protein
MRGRAGRQASIGAQSSISGMVRKRTPIQRADASIVIAAMCQDPRISILHLAGFYPRPGSRMYAVGSLTAAGRFPRPSRPPPSIWIILL